MGLKIASGFFLTFGVLGVACFLLACVIQVFVKEPPGATVMGAGLYWLVIIVSTLLGLLHLLLGIGLFRLKPWGRWLTVAYAGLFLGGCVKAVLGGDAMNLLGVALAGLLLWYVFRPSVKARFHPESPTSSKH